MADIVVEQHLFADQFELLEQSIQKEEYNGEEYFEFEIGEEPSIYLRLIKEN